MQTTSLRYFLTVVQCGSIAAASSRLNVATSAISRQIANLEGELGCVLFERRPRGMVASPAGDLLAQHASHILMRADQATAEIMGLQGLARGLIRIAANEGFALDLLPRVMARFHERFPGIRFELAVRPPMQATHLVATGEADIGLTFSLARNTGVAVVSEAMVPMIGLCAIGHPLANATDVPFSTLKDYPLVLMPDDTTSRQVFDAACREAGVTVEPVLTANALPSLLSFIRLTGAVAPLAWLSVEELVRRDEFAAFSLHDPTRISRMVEIQIMRDRQLPQVAQIFLDDLIAVLPATPRLPNSAVSLSL